MRIRTRRRSGTGYPALVAAVLVAGCGGETPTQQDPPGDQGTDTLPIPLAGGATTVFNATSGAFLQPAANLTGDRLLLFGLGQLGFNASFTPPGTGGDEGLGPLFNEAACEKCHRGGGRTTDSRLLRLSLEGTDARGGPRPVPGYGTQLQDRGVGGLVPEGQLSVGWVAVSGTYQDGATYTLRTPQVEISPAYAALPAHLSGIRTPRPLFGLGLLEAVPEATLLELADPNDADGDDISGRINTVWDTVAGAMVPGRFGWKATQPGLLHQIAAAYLEDMGVTSSVLPVESVANQPAHDDGLDDDPELDDVRLAEVLFFSRTVAVPARRDVNDPVVQQGEALFLSLGCSGCHVPVLQTGTLPDVPEVSGQTIYPYTDMLLHDMGEELSDGRPDFDASGSEWRTPPLWGLGLSDVVGNRVVYLHDGRAETLEEALLWHGGEAETARAAFIALTADARAALLRFLMSL